MLLTVTTTHAPATELGFLLHKHPDRVQQFAQSFGTVTVCYPEASESRCTAALLLEVDPIRLARTRGRATPDFSLAQYVNDRPYAASSLLAVALGDVFSTARGGRCAARPELAETAIPLEIGIPVLPARGGAEIVRRVFEPLGWSVEADPIALDERFPEWGDSRYLRVRLTGTLRLADALSQLYVLLPVFDEAKHYWQGSDEVDKLLRSGAGWLATHPDRGLIARRYLGRRSGLARVALARLAELGDELDDALEPPLEEETETAPAAGEPDGATEASAPEPRVPLNTQRHEAVLQALVDLGATSVIDLGCGPGHLLAELVRIPQLTRVAGCDVSARALQYAGRRLHLDRLSERQAERITLFQGALTYEDERFAGFDAAVLMEVIEHVDESRLPALERVVFGAARPRLVLVTTPNSDYNVYYPQLTGMRHADHRFEWDREQFAAWSERVATAYGYAVSRRGIGAVDAEHGSPTQLAVFVRG